MSGSGDDLRFCGTSPNFDAIKGRLAQFLQSWNTANPSTPADRALGVVADTVSRGSNDGCAEGMASVRGPEAWVRAIAPTSSAPSPTGSLMAMETAHTLGLVPSLRDDPYSAYHSPYTEADGTAPNRAYNTALRTFLANDRTALTLAGTWNDTNTVFERDDWSFLVCALGGQTSTECTTSGTLGSATGVGADPTFVIAGTTSHAETKVVESYFAPGVPRTLAAPQSEYRLFQLRNNGSSAGCTRTLDSYCVLRDDGVNVAFGAPVHDHAEPADPDPDPTFTTCPDCGCVECDFGAFGHEESETGVGSFSAAVPFDTGAHRIELRHGSELLYSRDRGSPPQVVSTTSDDGCGGSDGEVILFAAGPDCGQTVQVEATDDVPGDLRLDLFYVCGSGATEVRYPIAVGVVPDETLPGPPGTAFWNLPIDTTLGCEGGRVLAVVNDGFSQTAFTAVNGVNAVEPISSQKPPTAAVYGPLDGQQILQHDPIPLLGAAHDPEDGQLGSGAMSWSLTGPGITGVRNVGAGARPGDLPAPGTTGWTAGGPYTLTLTATDSANQSHTDTVSFSILADRDHDNLSEAAERCTDPQGTPDENPFNAYLDFDQDGRPNADDQTLTGEPCVASDAYAATFTIDPNPMPVVGAEGRVVTAYLKIPYRSASSVSAASVRISRIGGRRVNGFENVGWSVDKAGVGVAKFDRGALVRHLRSEGLLNRQVTITITGSGATARADGTSWSFTGIAPLTAK